jgi:antitoxin (DNA-binding transcriptional repressor) of toxin-antitoxin stability system
VIPSRGAGGDRAERLGAESEGYIMRPRLFTCNPGKNFLRILGKNIYNGYNKNMVTVGVRDLKNQLSQYLQFVKNGEKVVITEHNKIIAEISSPGDEKNDNILLVEQKLRKLSMEGEIVLAKRNETRVPIPETKEALDWKTIYDEVRNDRL